MLRLRCVHGVVLFLLVCAPSTSLNRSYFRQLSLSHMGRKPSQQQRKKEATRISSTVIGTQANSGSAAHWSALHKNKKTKLQSTTSVLVLITGELRIASQGHYDSISKSLKGSECFVVTYLRYHELGHTLCSTGLYVNHNEVSRLNETRPVPSSAWQWYLLQRGLDGLKDQISRYDTVVRFRVDLVLPLEFRFSDVENHQPAHGRGIVYAVSDFLFYSSPSIFFGAFSSMYELSIDRYQSDTMTVADRTEWKRLVESYFGMRISCLGKDEYAPKPRRNDPEKISHAVKAFPKLSKRIKAALNKELAFSDPNSHMRRGAGRRRRLLPTPGAPAKENLICGCKFALGSYAQRDRTRGGVGWKIPESMREYQAEPAMAYHILTHNASCLPVDLPNRDEFVLHEGRHDFTYGLTPLNYNMQHASAGPPQ